ncbi:hypothetical protein TWF718_009720 [Orbilia javanica]|uniref:Uncharacterized protein n=1 Tax=Orbilia javanica TaxID=47235 RepID=A0AAN8MZN2_9PEZI
MPWSDCKKYPPAPSPHTLVIRVARTRWMEFCHANEDVSHYSFRTPSAPDYKEYNDKTLRQLELLLLRAATGLYNPKTRFYAEFKGTNGDETDISQFKDYCEEDVVWEVVYKRDDGPLLWFPMRMISDYEEGKPIIPCLVHDDIKKGYYLPTWSEKFRHKWNCFWGFVADAPKEEAGLSKKTK